MQKNLEKYAKLLVRNGLNIQKDQLLVVNAPIEAAEFVRIVAKQAYDEGAKNVHVEYRDEELALVKYLNAPFEAFKEAMQKAGAILLEPIMRVEVTMPEEYMGDVIGDINSRRGRIEGMDDLGGGKIVHAYVPLAEMFGYSTDLRSKTQGRGNYSMFFDRYEPVPKNVQDKVLANHAK